MSDYEQIISKLISNELFEALSDVSKNVYIYVNDCKSGISRWSPAAVDYFGLHDEYLIDVAEWIGKIHPEDRMAYETEIREVFTGVKNHHSMEYRVKNKYGEYVWVECHGTMVYDKRGNQRVFAGIMNRIDVTSKYDGLTHLKTVYSIGNMHIREKDGFAVLVGIDSFRSIITKVGFHGSNEILKKFAERLNNYCDMNPENITAYRFTGDEFLVLYTKDSGKKPQEAFDDIASLGMHLSTEGGDHFDVKLSGGSLDKLSDKMIYNDIYEKLEYSLEFAKVNHRGELIEYSYMIEEEHKRYTELSLSLTKAIENNFDGFELYFQPIINPNTEKMGACEALIRWTSRELGRVPAHDTIQTVERTGEIVELGKWIIDSAFRLLSKWQRMGNYFIVSINVSYYQFREADFLTFVKSKLNTYRFDPQYVSLELTETANVSNIEYLSETFMELRRMGFKVTLDDFGTQYSNMDLLNNFDVDFIKIDQQFVSQLTSINNKKQYIVESIIDLCEKLNIDVIVEGVETKETVDLIKNYPINLIQGFYYSRPLPLREFEKNIENKFEVMDDKSNQE